MFTEAEKKLCLQYYPFQDDFGDSYDRVLRDQIVIANKLHYPCHICGGAIKYKEQHRVLVALWSGGDLMQYRWCYECCKAMIKSRSWDDNGETLLLRYRIGDVLRSIEEGSKYGN